MTNVFSFLLKYWAQMWASVVTLSASQCTLFGNSTAAHARIMRIGAKKDVQTFFSDLYYTHTDQKNYLITNVRNSEHFDVKQ